MYFYLSTIFLYSFHLWISDKVSLFKYIKIVKLKWLIKIVHTERAAYECIMVLV